MSKAVFVRRIGVRACSTLLMLVSGVGELEQDFEPGEDVVQRNTFCVVDDENIGVNVRVKADWGTVTLVSNEAVDLTEQQY